MRDEPTRTDDERSFTIPVAGSVLWRLVRFFRLKHIFRNHIDRKSCDGDPKPREHVAEHGAVGENRVLTPRLALCPWISIQWGWIGHLSSKKAAQRHHSQNTEC